MEKPIKKRKKRDTSKKHQMILDKAIAVFTKKGYDTTSMDKIAETAGVSKRTVYNHFQSKENLFQEIVADFIAERDSIKPLNYSSDIPLEEQLKTFARAEMHLIDNPRRRGISKLLTSVFLFDLEFGKSTHSQHSPYQSFLTWLEAAQKDGKLYIESPMVAARIFYGLVEGCITWPALMSDGATLKETELLLQEIVKVFISYYGK